MAKAKEVKTLCPGDDCENEVTLTIDDDGDYQGSCTECGLNVGRVMTRRRYDRAITRIAEREEVGKKGKNKKNDPFAL